jgi:hypothetical protein
MFDRVRQPLLAGLAQAASGVRGGLTARAAEWPWSSIHAHLAGRDDGVVTVAPILDRAPDRAAPVE